jgi:hypothetical protein
VSFASFFLTAPFGEQVNTALLDASPVEMMQDYPLHVLGDQIDKVGVKRVPLPPRSPNLNAISSPSMQSGS